MAKRFVPDGTEATFGKLKYTKAKPTAVGGGRPGYSSFSPDDQTLVLAAEPLLLRVMLAATKPNAGKPDWLAGWQKASTGQITWMLDVAAFNRVVGPDIKRAPQQQQEIMATFAPLWEQSQRWYAGVEVGNGIKLDSTVECAAPEAAERVRKTAEAALTLAGNLLDRLGDQIAKAPNNQAGPALIVADLAETLLKQAKLTTERNTVRLHAEVELDEADTAETAISALVPAVLAAREAAGRAQSVNNLKQIALAFHNYHDVYGHFPPAAVIGPDGKTPHSWRVAILPFVEQTELYNQYKFDEPWDSENNKKILRQVPPVYRDPGADAATTFSSYYVLTGEATLFGPKEGVRLADVLDGTSNTILAVEAKREIPWTKPEDIAYDAAKPLPKLGGWHPGGFDAAFADGSVRFIQENIDQTILRALITRAGGEQVP